MITKMFNPLFITTISFVMHILVTTLCMAQISLKELSKDHFEIILENTHLDSIRIIQVTDLHLGTRDKWKDDLNTFSRIKKLVNEYEPHFIFITGDLFTGEKPYGSLLAAYAVHFFDALDRPWFYTFGNHDPEGGFGRDDIYNVFSTSEWGILGFHGSNEEKKYDYFVDIKLKTDVLPRWQVYAFDTGPHQGIKAIQTDQIEWYKKMSQQSKINYHKSIPSIGIFHIPLIQYQQLWDEENIEKEGISLEKVYYEEDNGSLYDAFLEVGNIKATFCGHDHYNNYWGKYLGDIILAYGYISGESTNEAWPTGGKLILLPIDDGEIGIRNVIPKFKNGEHKY